jgi:hypothetical protein
MMDAPYWLLILGLVWFGFLTGFYIIKARRKKEKTYYLGALLGSSMILLIVLVFLNQKILALVLMAAMTVLSIVTRAVVIKTQTREATVQLQETDLTAALRLRDFFTYKGVLKLAHRWGVVKTVSIYFVLTFVGVACALYILSMYGIGTIVSVIGNAILASLLISITFYHIINKALKKSK